MTRTTLLEIAAKALARLFLPAAAVRHPRRGRHHAAQWALGLRFPRECLDGLHPHTRAAFEAARAEAFWRDGQLIGLTSGHRDAAEQYRLYTEAVRAAGSHQAARHWVLPPSESCHVQGTALDVRPSEGAAWLERHGDRFHLYSRYDNEPWHFELWPARPARQPHPGAAPLRRSC
ncbi:D-alanyl-D-alanine carboxypeptidase family protein [Kutzneria buriramensis]|uniref:D-alanyl-D-alanine carboxypeptidase-like protein n=1 Tax=Kutzneria buriramensis TaxID=1045776 RepID=A0A3E0GT23_9PSEU|nr:D-alanyl-D-alanine carboxypeptidase family protein [Kutzneria buriramensis]REH26436.1 D-alanyl-D-alanine carboxypeptidase-like protein [Kutzneria buriramensis]